MSSTKLQDKLMLILSLLSPFVITGKAESCRSRKPASAPARNLMNLFDLCRYCCPTQKFCSVKQLAGVRRVHSFHARFLFFFLSISTYTLCKFYQETSFPWQTYSCTRKEYITVFGTSFFLSPSSCLYEREVFFDNIFLNLVPRLSKWQDPGNEVRYSFFLLL